jgi:hypothetical protein
VWKSSEALRKELLSEDAGDEKALRQKFLAQKAIEHEEEIEENEGQSSHAIDLRSLQYQEEFPALGA